MKNELTYAEKQEAINASFTTELKELLAKYGAQIYAKDEYMGYPECGEEIHIYVESKVTSGYEPSLTVDLGNGL